MAWQVERHCLGVGIARRLSVRTWKSVLLFVATAMGFAWFFVMLQRVIGRASPWLGLLAMFYFLGLVKVAEPLCLLRMPLPLRTVRAWESSGAIYRQLLVPEFGKLLKETPLRLLNPAVYLAQDKADLGKLHRLVEAAEAAHFWAALLFMPYIAFIWLGGQQGVAMVFLVVQVLFNVYPILHLRIVRDRLIRLQHRRALNRQPTSAEQR